MKSKIAAICSLTIFLAAGCFSMKSVNQVQTPSPITLVQTDIPSPLPDVNIWSDTPTPLLMPTISASQQADLLRLINYDACHLRCYLGIEPGNTTFEQAKNTIIDMGGTIRADYENFYESYPEKQPLRLTTYILNFRDVTIYQDINVSEKDGKVQQIVVDVFGNFEPMFYEGWKKYSMKAVFQNYGVPDQITIVTGKRSYAVRVAYLEYGTIIEWSGIHQEDSSDYKICPEFSSENTTSLLVAAADTKSPFDIIPSSYMGIKEMYKSTEEIIGISEKEFYNQVVADDSVCFHVLVK